MDASADVTDDASSDVMSPSPSGAADRALGAVDGRDDGIHAAAALDRGAAAIMVREASLQNRVAHRRLRRARPDKIRPPRADADTGGGDAAAAAGRCRRWRGGARSPTASVRSNSSTELMKAGRDATAGLADAAPEAAMVPYASARAPSMPAYMLTQEDRRNSSLGSGRRGAAARRRARAAARVAARDEAGHMLYPLDSQSLSLDFKGEVKQLNSVLSRAQKALAVRYDVASTAASPRCWRRSPRCSTSCATRTLTRGSSTTAPPSRRPSS